MKIEINKVDFSHDDNSIFGSLTVQDDICATLAIKEFICEPDSIDELLILIKEAYFVLYPEYKK